MSSKHLKKGKIKNAWNIEGKIFYKQNGKMN